MYLSSEIDVFSLKWILTFEIDISSLKIDDLSKEVDILTIEGK